MGLLVLLSGLLLSACSRQISVDEVCEQEPQMCNDLNPDGWCATEKNKIILHRYYHQHSSTGRDQYFLMEYFEDYQACISQAANIRHIKGRDKENLRVRGLLTAERELNRLQQETKGNNNPYLLYYHWSRFGDQEAIKQFLAYENTGKLESAELQLGLAMYYMKSDLLKTRHILYHALELYTEEEVIDPMVFSSLTTINLNLEEIDKAFIWGRIATDYQIKGIDMGAIEVMALQQGFKLDQLRNTADQYMADIEAREFVSPEAGTSPSSLANSG